MTKFSSELQLECPCCGTALVVDLNLRRIVAHHQPEREDKPEFDSAQRILAEEAERREALFQRSVADEKGRGDALSKRFEEALKQVQKEPVERPMRDFDLD